MHEHPAFSEYAKVDEIPFDFSRRMMSVVVKTPGGAHRLICKGAPEEVSSGAHELRAGRRRSSRWTA